MLYINESVLKVWGSLSSWKSYHIVSLGRIALALTEDEIEELDLHLIDTISVLSQQSEWTPTQVSTLLNLLLDS